MANRTATIKAVVLGDASEFKEAMQDVEQAADKAGDSVKRDLNESFDALGEGAGSAEQKFIGLSDSITGTQDVMEGLRTGNVAQLAMGFADLAGSFVPLALAIPVLTLLSARLLKKQADDNQRLEQRNQALAADVIDLKHGEQAVEARARNELGLIKPGETFYQVVEKPAQAGSAPAAAASTPGTP